MNNRFELLIQLGTQSGVTELLDTFGDGDISVPLNYNIADINNIASKNSSYSKTIDIPDTKNNRTVFNYVFDLNSNSSFDINKKTKCWVLKDTVIQFEGNLQMTGISYDRQTNRDSYQCVIYADNDTLFSNIGEKFISQLSLTQFNHTYNTLNIVQSWNSDYERGYYYPLMDLAGNIDANKVNNLNTTDFYPATYLKPIIDQIFVEAGYSYKSNFLNSTFFKQLVIPFNNSSLLPNIQSNLITGTGPLTNVIFQAGLSATQSITSGSSSFGFEWADFGCNIDIYDPNNFYDNTGFDYSNPGEVIFAQKFIGQVKFFLDNSGINNSPWTCGTGSGMDDVQVIVKRSYDLITGLTVSGWGDTPPSLGDIVSWPVITFAGSSYWSLKAAIAAHTVIETQLGLQKFTYQTTFQTDYLNGPTGSNTQPLRPGEQVRFFFARHGFASYPSPPTANPTTQLCSNGTNSLVIESVINPSIMGINFGLSYSSFVSQNVKQKDLLTSVINMFDLYIEPDKGSANTFRIEDYENYLAKYQVIKDWTTKLDLSQPITTEFASNTQKRKNIFSYTPDKDYYNSFYTTATNQVYGQYEWDINNDFITDENDITPIFSPTPIDLLKGTNNIYTPSIINFNNGNIGKYSGYNIRILYKNILPVTLGDNFKFNGTSYTKYPYVGPVDNPILPTVSLNFGTVPSFYPGYVETTNNLFYNYWQQQMANLSNKNTRIITAYFFLTSQDISQFYFSDLIFFRIDGCEVYYRVNKIIDYDPSTNNSTQVELITAQNYNIV